jgi:hypothetical protein
MKNRRKKANRTKTNDNTKNKTKREKHTEEIVQVILLHTNTI